MSISSINFQKAKSHAFKHNFRLEKINYLLRDEDRKENFYWESKETEENLFKEELDKKNKEKKVGKRPTLANSRWEAVLNLNANHTLKDVKQVAEYIEKKFNIYCTSIALHNDEGHYDNLNNIVLYNHHAHIIFMTYKDKKQNWTREKITRKKLIELQTKVAELLNMERGTNKDITGRERLNHKQYKYMCQEKNKIIKKYEQKICQQAFKIKLLEKKITFKVFSIKHPSAIFNCKFLLRRGCGGCPSA